MRTRQRIIVLVLLCLGLLQQGVRWHQASKGTISIEQAVEAAATPETELGILLEENRHCSLVHVNTAGLAELQTLPGIGPVYAQRIIAARQERPFLEKSDLLRVAGIGEKRLAQIADLICLYFERDAEE